MIGVASRLRAGNSTPSGPRPEDRGEHDLWELREIDHWRQKRLQTGPRPEDRGELGCRPADAPPMGNRGASMGPRPEDRGERSEDMAGTAGAPPGKLQWGHGPKTVENPSRADVAIWRQHRLASMGPRSEDRGEPPADLPSSVPSAAIEPLQWGHGPKTVENPDVLDVTAAVKAGESLLTEATARRLWENLPFVGGGSGGEVPSMGPRPEDRGEPRPPEPGAAPKPRSFNGATARR